MKKCLCLTLLSLLNSPEIMTLYPKNQSVNFFNGFGIRSQPKNLIKNHLMQIYSGISGRRIPATGLAAFLRKTWETFLYKGREVLISGSAGIRKYGGRPSATA
ncbi:hypothetical protein ABGM91_07875 [Akkermansia muciniphila]|uniref:hypothetical protein n=1 Tax=Akkermansia muciniphila TaxID=239935 RepID=UPI0033AD9988